MSRSAWPLIALSTLASAVNIFLPIAMVRRLPQEEVGLFRILFLYLQFIPPLTLSSGLINGLYLWAGKTEDGPAALRATSTLITSLALGVTIILLLVTPFLPHLMGLDTTLMMLFSASAFGMIAGTFYEDIAIATGTVWRGSLFYASSEIIRTSLLLIVATITSSLHAVMTTHVVVSTIKTILGLILGSRSGLVRFEWDSVALTKVTRYALPISSASLFLIFMTSVDQYVLSTMIPTAAFAVYSVGRLSIPPLLILEQSVMRVLIPQLSRCFEKERWKEASYLFRDAVGLLGYLYIPSVIGLSLFAEPIIVLLFKEKYRVSAQYLQVYAFSYLVYMFPYDAVARATGRSKWIFYTFLSCGFFSIGAAFFLAWKFGPYGALAALFLTDILRRLVAFRHDMKITSWKFREFIPVGALTRNLLIAGLMAWICHTLRPLFASEIRWFLGGGLLFALGFNIISLVVKNIMDPREKNFLTIVQTVDIGGLERLVLLLTSRFKQEGVWSPFVLAYNHEAVEGKPSLVPEFEAAHVPLVTYKKGRGFSLSTVARILMLVFRHHIRVVHTHDIGGLMYASMAWLLSLGRFRILHTQHSFIHLTQVPRYRWYERVLSLVPRRITAVSEEVKGQYALVGRDPKKITLIQNGVTFLENSRLNESSIKEARAELRAILTPSQASIVDRHNDSLWILYLARLYPRKGQDHAIRMWSELSPEFRSRATLLLVGPEALPGEEQRLRDLIMQYKFEDSVEILGGSPSPFSWLRASHVYLLLSESEGMPLGSLEAVGSGIPSLLSEIPGHDFLVNFAPRVAFDDPKEAAGALEALVHASSESESRPWYQQQWERTSPLRTEFDLSRAVLLYRSELEATFSSSPTPLVPQQGSVCN
jgi:O-antigen/teichoic acid export membrane protein/glycosyltransferase involved in cell wall biosynthesis